MSPSLRYDRSCASVRIINHPNPPSGRSPNGIFVAGSEARGSLSPGMGEPVSLILKRTAKSFLVASMNIRPGTRPTNPCSAILLRTSARMICPDSIASVSTVSMSKTLLIISGSFCEICEASAVIQYCTLVPPRAFANT